MLMIDSFKFPASAVAAISFLRCLFAGAFPLFGEKLFARLGLDWGVGLLAFLVLGVGLPLVALVCYHTPHTKLTLTTPSQLYTFGARLRATGVQRMERFESSKKATN
jgi:hypothetical protein